MNILEKLEAGVATPEQALKEFNTPGTHISDIMPDFDVTPLECGFPTFEHYGYLRAGKPDLAIIAARPGVGKTALVCQIALNVAKKGSVLVFSIEMAKEQLQERFIAVEAEKPIKKLGLPINRPAVMKAIEAFKNVRMTIDDTNAININDIVARTVAHNKASKLSLVVVDYAQIVTVNSMRSKAEEVSMVAEKLKTLAKMIKCPVLTVAQMNRQFDGRLTEDPQARPIMSDLADSAGLEKWADMVMCLHKPFPEKVKAFVLKNRHGEAFDFDLQFSGSMTRFYEAQDHGEF